MQDNDNPSGDPTQLPSAPAQQMHTSPGDEGVSSDSSVSSQGVLSGNDSQPPPVEPFPVDVLPGPARQMVEEGAAAFGVPPELVAIPLLVFAGATIGTTRRIQLKLSYQLHAILWAAVVATPGAAKSPALALARYPLDVLQEEADARFGADWQAYKKKGAPKNEEEPELPQREHFFSTDATTEAIADMLASSPGLAVVRDELIGWVKAFDAYRRGLGGDRQTWLSLWNGDPFKIDRKTSGHVYIPNPVVCVCGGVQPDMLAALGDEAGRRDGFIERILWSYPDTHPSGWTDADVAQETKDAVVKVFRQLRKSTSDEPVKLSPQAKARWVKWYNDNALSIEQTEGILQGVYAKLPNQAARLALILHCMKNAGLDGPHLVDSETMEGALRLAEYFRSHAQRAVMHFGPVADTPTATLTKRVLRLLRLAQGDWVGLTSLHKQLGGHEDAEALSQALTVLKSKGLAEQRIVSNPKGGRPKEEWRAITPCEETNKPKKP